MSEFDVAIIGAGIAGASLAAQFKGDQKIVLIEAEDRPGYHATGRSAAFWTESYGGPLVQPLTTASGPFLANPPPDFSDHGFLTKRGALYLGTTDDRENADALFAQFGKSGVQMEQLGAEQIAKLIPEIRPEWDRAIWELSCCDIDVSALHAAYLRQAKQRGVTLVCSAEIQSASWRDNIWNIQSKAGNFKAGILVNAAGAWADTVAQLCGIPGLGIQPYRRTIMQLRIAPLARDDLPLVIGLDGSFYFKSGGAGRLWLSPHDEAPSVPCDTAPDDLDIAKAIERLRQVVDWEVIAIEAKWAGLRSFAPDRLPVIGADPSNPAFFWLAGQGGFGIQTAPAIAALAAAQLSAECEAPIGIAAKVYAPQRLR